MEDFRRTLRLLAVRDVRFIDLLLQSDRLNASIAGVDPRTHALARLGALIAVGGAPPDYSSSAEAALEAGASHEEIVGVLIAVLPVVGIARVVSAAPDLGLALGYDVAAALEELEDAPSS